MHGEERAWTPSPGHVQASSLLLEARPMALRYVHANHVRDTGELNTNYHAERSYRLGLL